MYRLIRDHNKKLIAVFAVVLMIAFLMPVGMQQMSDNTGVARAYMGDEAITVGDYQRARSDWDILLNQVTTTTMMGQPVPLLLSLGDPSPQRLAELTGLIQPNPYSNTPPAPIEIIGGPDTFLLLLKEAEAAGITVSDERVDLALASDYRLRSAVDAGETTRTREAIRDFLMVEASYARVAGVAKSTQPMRQRLLARGLARINADIVSFSSAPAGIPTTAAVATTAPSQQDLQALFDKYADVPVGLMSETNPLGFGYQVPDRVKVQTLSINRDQLVAAIEKTRSPYDWGVAARKYFLLNKAEFPAAEPTTVPSPTTGFDLSAAPAATRPTERSFSDLPPEQQKQATDRVMEPEIAALSAKINTYLTDRFTKDYAAAGPATQPTTATTTASATTPPADGYPSYGYLEQVAQDVQKQFGVLPSVTNHADWLDRTAARALPNIGGAMLSDSSIDFASLVFAGEPFTTTSAGLRMKQFSQPLEDFQGNLYYFRVTDAEPKHRAPSLESVLAQVQRDAALKKAADAAREAANALIETAKAGTLESVAQQQGREVTAVGPVNPGNQFEQVPGLDLADTADRAAFLSGVWSVLSSETRDAQGRPLGMITLPTSRQVLAVNVTSAPVEPTSDGAFTDQISAALFETSQRSAALQQDWFSFDGVSKRINFKGDRPDTALTAAAPAAMN
ncbi:MAG TPA: hypothetical protein VGN72_04785 [Tepidisphaeraceae bacterium]|jgi:hypothetical protein|nr:hypothetical protein [Tepidisphaeraceae bacterium]